jgi:protein-tyrosine phosphatase
MAEALLRTKAGDRFDVRSAGVFAPEGMPPAKPAEQVLSDKGIELNHRTSTLNQQWISWADLVLTMTQDHKGAVLRQFPESFGKVYTLKEYVQDDDEANVGWGRMDDLFAELETERALANAERVKELEEEMDELRNALPSLDISDPFGGTMVEYGDALNEIERAIELLIRKERTED